MMASLCRVYVIRLLLPLDARKEEDECPQLNADGHGSKHLCF
jgi:hypothetical protein